MTNDTTIEQQATQTRLIPRKLLAELEQTFPLDVRRKDSRRINQHCRSFVLMFVNRAQHNTAAEFRFSQKVLDETILDGSRCKSIRTKLVAYFKASEFIRVVSLPLPTGGFIENRKTQNVYTLNGLRKSKLPPYNTATTRLLLPVRSGSFSSCSDVYIPSHFRFPHRSCQFEVDLGWEKSIAEAMKEAARRLGHFVDWDKCLADSFSRLIVLEPTESEVRDLTNDDAQAERWLTNWRRVHTDRKFGRCGGRTYHCLSNQPKEMRRRFLRFNLNGIVEHLAEVDMSSCYWVLLVSAMPECPEKNRLIELLVSGGWYRYLESICRKYKQADYQKLKIATQIQCLFDDARRAPLFAALCGDFPEFGKFLRRLRSRGASSLSMYLNQMEGRFFIDTVLPEVCGQGIPCLTLHDAVLIPESEAKTVQELCVMLALEHFGFAPLFKISYSPLSSEFQSSEPSSTLLELQESVTT